MSLLVALLALVLVSCGSGADVAAPDTARGSTVPVEQVPGSPAEDVPSALDDPADARLPTPLVDVDRLISGGPPPDGIPAIDEPRFTTADQVDFLAESEPVLALDLDGIARAYPVQVVIWHEIVNDTVGGTPLAVTYCPLCNSALAFDRRAAGRVLTFGVSGRLYNSDLVMFDRQTKSLWPQLEGRAVAGVLTGTELAAITVQTVPWGVWRDAHPRGQVLTRDTGYDRDYGRNRYVGYDQPDTDPFLLDVEADDRLPAKTRVVGLGEGAAAVAVVTSELQDDGVREVTVDSSPVVLLALPGLASALDTAEVADGRDVGVTGAFSPVVNGQRVTFRRVEAGFVDDQTGSAWSVLGRATSGPLAGTQLDRVRHVDTFWFAWVLFQPDTDLVD